MTSIANRVTGPNACIVVFGGVLALLAGFAAQKSVELPLIILAAVALVTALVAVNPRYLVTGIICYIPFEALVASYVHGRASLIPLYAAEIAALLLLFRLAISERPPVGRRVGWVGISLALMTAVWIIAGVWGGRTAYSMLVGYRAELRFLPLMFIPLYSWTPLRDTRLFGRAIVFVAALQASIGFLEILGGSTVRRLVQHSATANVGGVVVKYSSRTDTIASTFKSYNDLSSFLILGWIVLLCAGPSRLGLSRWFVIPLGVLVPIVVVGSGSREGTFALAISGLVILGRRYRMPAIAGAAIAVLVGILYLPYAVNNTNPTGPTGAIGAKQSGNVNASQLMARWSLLLDPTTYSGDAHSKNFRLYLALSEAGLVSSHHPVVGYGLGSVTDKRLATQGRSPLDLIQAGREAIADNYAFDGLWPLMLVEVGFLGLAATWFFLFSIGRTGFALTRFHWIGVALIADVVVVLILGFFGGDLQQHVTGAVLWASAGYALALRGSLVWSKDPAQGQTFPAELR